MRSVALVIALCAGLTGCSQTTVIPGAESDAGLDDKTLADTTPQNATDSSAPDASAPDSEPPDSGAPDSAAAPQDTGVADSATPLDAAPDTSAPTDTGTMDTATTSMDSATPDTMEPPEDTGDPWSGTPCAVGGRDGVCLDIDECDGERVATPGFCPGPSWVQCCTEPGAEPTMCDPDNAPLPDPLPSEESGEGGCALGMVRIDAFCIDRYEAALVEVLDNGQERPWSPYVNPGQARVRAVSAQGVVPQGYIDGFRAERACLEAGKRLCSNDEWLRACQGPDELTFPYGDARQPGVCNDARSRHPVVELFGTNDDWIWSELGNACINQLEDGLARTGAYTECVTSEGVHDAMGNLHEWTSTPSGIFRGGFYVDTERNGPGCLYRTTAHNRYHWDYSTGFRCCSEPEAP